MLKFKTPWFTFDFRNGEFVLLGGTVTGFPYKESTTENTIDHGFCYNVFEFPKKKKGKPG